ncbi:MAG: sugar dehydrogenase complex small subunit [Sulfuritalea sp.]|nr:sugar dehydrogenase complex small subunit [Sulfuritalea sp.]
MKRFDLSRRVLIAALLGGGTTLLASRYWLGEAAAQSILKFNLPVPAPAEDSSFALFFALSQLVTQRPQLDEAVARRMYPLFLDEPWGAHHIHSTYIQLWGLLKPSTTNANPAQPALSSVLGKGQAWFAAHLLTTWYLGVYYHERMPPLRVAHAEALMFDCLHPEIPRPFAESTGFGEWGNPPPTRNRS